VLIKTIVPFTLKCKTENQLRALNRKEPKIQTHQTAFAKPPNNFCFCFCFWRGLCTHT